MLCLPLQSEKLDTMKDTLNHVGVLHRREIEARVLAPFIEALSENYPRPEIDEILKKTIIRIAREQGATLRGQIGRNDLVTFAGALDAWTQDQALEIEVLEQNEQRFAFNVTRCRYAEMYRQLGIPELGAVLSCNRDYSLIEGFNPNVELERNQTLMEGADCCNFRYRLAEE